MADTIVDVAANAVADDKDGLWGPYWSDVNTGVIVYVDSGFDISFARTTDKGANWNITEIEAGTVRQLAVWYDKETPGDTGTLVHIAWLDSADAEGSQDARYVTVDVSDGGVGAIRTVDGDLTVDNLSRNNRIAITKAVNGRMLVAFSTQTEIECYKSAETSAPYFAAAATDIADVFETATQEDWVILFPANVDAGDCCALFWDRSTDELSVKMYDDSDDSWTETSISGSMVDDSIHKAMDGAVRHSDNHVEIAAHSNEDDAGDDLLTWDLTVDSIASPTITAKANIFTDQGESAQVSVHINQQNDDVRVAYLKGGTWQATVDVVYHLSDDGMGSWGAEQAYSEAAADDIRLVPAGRTVGDDGGRYQPCFYNSDLRDIFVNETNDVEITAAAAFVLGQAAITGVGSLVPAASLILPASAVFAGVGSVVAAGTIGTIQLGAAVLAGAGTLTAVPTMTFIGQASPAGVGTLVAVGERVVPGAAVLDGVGNMIVIGEVGIEGRAVIAGVGSLTVVGRRIVAGQAVLSGVGSLTPAGVITVVGAAALAGVGAVAVIGETGAILFTIFGGITREIDPADFPAGASFFFEAVLAAPTGGTARARLYNITDAAEVADSELTTPNVDETRLRSSALTLPSGAKIYRTEYGGAAGDVYTVFAADLLVESG